MILLILCIVFLLYAPSSGNNITKIEKFCVMDIGNWKLGNTYYLISVSKKIRSYRTSELIQKEANSIEFTNARRSRLISRV